MKDMITILKYTIKENVTKKSFIITTIILMLMIVLVCNIPNIVNTIGGEEKEEQSLKYVLIDHDNIIGNDINALVEMGKTINWEIDINTTNTDEAIEKIQNNEIDGMLEVLLDEETKSAKLKYTSNGSIYVDDQSIINQFISMIKTIQINNILKQANVSPESLNIINADIEYETKHLQDGNENSRIAMAA